jgi:hypothetical protein
MADLSITAANVKIKSATTRTKIVQFGETMTAGQPAYLKSTDLKYWKADANASAAAAAALGVVLVGAAGDAYGVIVDSGAMDLGATLTVGVPYIVSTTAGGIAPASDFAGYTGSFLTHLGYATSTSSIDIRPFVTGAAN